MVIEQQPSIAAALERAHTEHITATQYHATHDARYDRTWFAVTSGTRQNVTYDVTVTCNAGGVFSECSCPAGMHERMCKHQAAALEAMNLLGAQADTRPVEEPVAPAPARWISPGDALARLCGAA